MSTQLTNIIPFFTSHILRLSALIYLYFCKSNATQIQPGLPNRNFYFSLPSPNTDKPSSHDYPTLDFSATYSVYPCLPQISDF
ncbi:hypothetical protein EYC80_010904 [Monilinia laxa]|uniref:Uncharacterized protein n=1 Tax=Monilinia laxa TaxID=61186 RepID=A0A5N6JSG1_MONLA|nr:hypothetical protein EYC80_010904 [Monilinia laxa]